GSASRRPSTRAPRQHSSTGSSSARARSRPRKKARGRSANTSLAFPRQSSGRVRRDAAAAASFVRPLFGRGARVQVDPPDLGFAATAVRLLRVWREQWRLVLLGLSCALITTALSLSIAILIRHAIDSSIAPVSGRRQHLWPYVVLVLVLSAVRVATNFTRRYAMPLVGLLTWLFAVKVMPVSRLVQQLKADVTEAADEAVVGIEMVQAFGREDDVRSRFGVKARAVRDGVVRQARIEGNFLPGLL